MNSYILEKGRANGIQNEVRSEVSGFNFFWFSLYFVFDRQMLIFYVYLFILVAVLPEKRKKKQFNR